MSKFGHARPLRSAAIIRYVHDTQTDRQTDGQTDGQKQHLLPLPYSRRQNSWTQWQYLKSGYDNVFHLTCIMPIPGKTFQTSYGIYWQQRRQSNSKTTNADKIFGFVFLGTLLSRQGRSWQNTTSSDGKQFYTIFKHDNKSHFDVSSCALNV